jgi:hypothetical protein
MKHQCSFCKQDCKLALQDDEFYLTAWFSCESCNVGFQKHIGGRLELTRFYANFRNHRYCLDLRHNIQETQILQLPDKVEDTVIIVFGLPYVIQGVTPENCQAKIETYITFS